MLRKLIALLVLVTGLAAIGQPAQALNVDVERVGLSLDAGYACVATQAPVSGQLTTRSERGEREPKMCPRPPRIVLIVPTVMLQADRARE